MATYRCYLETGRTTSTCQSSKLPTFNRTGVGHLGSLPRLVEDRDRGGNPIVSRGATYETGGTTSTSQSSDLCVWNARTEVDAPDTSQLDTYAQTKYEDDSDFCFSKICE